MEAIKELDWYFDHLDNPGLIDCAAKTAYKELKKYLEQADKMYKVNIYLLRKYKNDLIKEFKGEDEIYEYIKLMNIFEEIAKVMNEEIPGPWYTYGIGRKENV